MATALKIKAKAAGYRRAGHKFDSETETVIAVKGLNKEQVEMLKSDANLLVSEVEIKAAADADDAAAKAKAAANKK